MSEADQDEWRWEAFMSTALQAYSKGRRQEAQYFWAEAHRIARCFSEQDPRRACGLNNTAIASMLDEDYLAAEQAFDDALTAWGEAAHWPAAMKLPIVARSSLFHFRMEQRHSDSFDKVRRHHLASFLNAAPAATKFNAALCKLFLDKDREADTLLDAALTERRQASGSDPEALLMCKTLYGRAEAAQDQATMQQYEAQLTEMSAVESIDSLQRWQQEQPQKMDDHRRLLSAVYLTAMLHERDFL